MAEGPYRLLGANASPYSMKMRAILRYRRLPFIWEPASPRLAEAFQSVRPAVVPVLQFPDGRFANDSTVLVQELERRHPGERSVMPDPPGHGFLSALLEDMADEWATKCLFHYRWWYEPDREFASIWVVGDRYFASATMPAAAPPASAPDQPVAGAIKPGGLDAEIRRFHDRQVGRMAVVGATETNKPLTEETYLRILAAFDQGIVEQPFLFGSRPSVADFAWFGQLWTLAMDPTPGGLMRTHAPRLLPWLLRADDTSGVEGAWQRDVTPWTARLLDLAGSVYLPFLKANADALKSGADNVSVRLLGHDYSQAPFKYQGKCYAELRRQFSDLDPGARKAIDPALERSGCLPFLR